MTTQTITLTLPVGLMERAQLAAQVLNHPIEQVLTAVLSATLPDLSNAPADMQAELLQMSLLTEQELWSVAESRMRPEQQVGWQKLNESALVRLLSKDEQQQREALLNEYDRILIRKARAYALLSARSGRLLLADRAQN
jgi:hypothetical protein